MMPEPLVTIGWDVGGVQVKAARVETTAGHPRVVRTAVRALEIWRRRDQLPGVLRELAAELSAGAGAAHGLTMTAELSDAFRDKREGVRFVMDGLDEAFPRSAVFAVDNDGVFVPLPEARTRPLAFAATNWIASALYAAPRIGDGILVDVGSTTTDIIPIRQGHLACEGRTDLDRLVAGELVYCGVLRTNPNTLASAVPVRGRPCRLAAEQFAVMADVYLILGLIGAEDYSCPTPDGRAASTSRSSERLARLVCADREMLSGGEIVGIARYLHERHLQVISEGLLQVLSRWEGLSAATVAPAGAGAFLASAVAARLGLEVLPAADLWGDAGVTLPAAAAACLLASHLGSLRGYGGETIPRDPSP
jgi:probable H4MPT-linked C1 transfer pathway protein